MPPHAEDASTILQKRVEAPPAKLAIFELAIVRGAEAGAVFRLDGAAAARVLVGQSPVCDVRLSDREVSRRHCAMDVAGSTLRITDLGSKNGTFVNGIGVVDAFLRGGEGVRVGQTEIQVRRLGESPGRLTDELRFGRLVGGSVAMRRLYPVCERIAAADVPVVLEGETGTGKELLAEALHEASARAAGPFVVMDCASIAPEHLEAELFGSGDQPGLLERAHGGTLLLDEVGELAIALQPKLLRALERAEVRRVGEAAWRRVDVRILSSSRRNLDQEVQAGRFRDDLFFRIAVARIELPPLREREGDTGLLARHFWRQLGGGARAIPADFVERLEAYSFPGNVRELRNTVARRVALGALDEAGFAPGAVPQSPRASAPDALSPHWADTVLALDLPLPTARQRLVDEFERRYVERVVAKYGGNIARAAAASGIARRYFQVLRARQKPK